MTKNKYCNNCKQVIKPDDQFSIIVFIVLLFVFGLGFLYLFITLFLKDKCPICRTTNLSIEKPQDL